MTGDRLSVLQRMASDPDSIVADMFAITDSVRPSELEPGDTVFNPHTETTHTVVTVEGDDMVTIVHYLDGLVLPYYGSALVERLPF
ncbi:hypothetical protein [Aeromicrobium sp. 179-A 4D2 NHS]|uniref:hypothetical protein n=1 Tax=Aeromicrobium sp. 179-A 4D2 NHS TaxID=3142375 RepID=UPI00399FBBD7